MMTLKRMQLAGALVVAGACLMQLVPAQVGNPPVDKRRAIGQALTVPPHIQNVMNKACATCHSNETEWPWYSKVAPVSWLTARDVQRGRKAMNFSEWADADGHVSMAALGKLAAACEDVKTGRMPLAPYKMMHPEARLSGGEVKSFCEWTTSASRQMMAARRAAGKEKTKAN